MNGEPRAIQSPTRQRTQERLLDGALQAIARHGLSKLAMSDVSECAGVSRGTVYRYFSSCDELLAELGRREAERFERQVWEALERAPEGADRLQVILEYVVRLSREHPLLRRLPETDPAFVLTSLRERFPSIRDSFRSLLGPQLDRTDAVRSGIVTTEQLLEWMTRALVSTFLFPDRDPDRTAEALAAFYRLLTARSFPGAGEP